MLFLERLGSWCFSICWFVDLGKFKKWFSKQNVVDLCIDSSLHTHFALPNMGLLFIPDPSLYTLHVLGMGVCILSASNAGLNPRLIDSAIVATSTASTEK